MAGQPNKLVALQKKKDQLDENKRKGLTVAVIVGNIQVWPRNTVSIQLSLDFSLMAHEYGDTKAALRH